MGKAGNERHSQNVDRLSNNAIATWRGGTLNVATTAATSTVEAVRVDNLHKSFGPLEVIKGVSLTATEGDVIAIIGGSGSGKSTLLRCINFLETPTSGTISICGEPVKMKPDGKGGAMPADRRQLERIRTSLGMVFQSFNLWQHMTVIQNVVEVPVHVLGQSKDAAYAKGEELLKRVGLWEKRDVYPAIVRPPLTLSTCPVT